MPTRATKRKASAEQQFDRRDMPQLKQLRIPRKISNGKFKMGTGALQQLECLKTQRRKTDEDQQDVWDCLINPFGSAGYFESAELLSESDIELDVDFSDLDLDDNELDADFNIEFELMYGMQKSYTSEQTNEQTVEFDDSEGAQEPVLAVLQTSTRHQKILTSAAEIAAQMEPVAIEERCDTQKNSATDSCLDSETNPCLDSSTDSPVNSETNFCLSSSSTDSSVNSETNSCSSSTDSSVNSTTDSETDSETDSCLGSSRNSSVNSATEFSASDSCMDSSPDSCVDSCMQQEKLTSQKKYQFHDQCMRQSHNAQAICATPTNNLSEQEYVEQNLVSNCKCGGKCTIVGKEHRWHCKGNRRTYTNYTCTKCEGEWTVCPNEGCQSVLKWDAKVNIKCKACQLKNRQNRRSGSEAKIKWRWHRCMAKDCKAMYVFNRGARLRRSASKCTRKQKGLPRFLLY